MTSPPRARPHPPPSSGRGKATGNWPQPLPAAAAQGRARAPGGAAPALGPSLGFLPGRPRGRGPSPLGFLLRGTGTRKPPPSAAEGTEGDAAGKAPSTGHALVQRGELSPRGRAGGRRRARVGAGGGGRHRGTDTGRQRGRGRSEEGSEGRRGSLRAPRGAGTRRAASRALRRILRALACRLRRQSQVIRRRPELPPPLIPSLTGPAGPFSAAGSATGGRLGVRGNPVRPEQLPARLTHHWLFAWGRGGGRGGLAGGSGTSGTHLGCGVQAGRPSAGPSASGACGERRARGRESAGTGR